MKESFEYKNIDKFIKDGKSFACRINSLHPNAGKKQRIECARKTFYRLTKRYYIIGKISTKIKKILNAKTADIKFSMDNLIKNNLEHPELNLKDYKNLCNYLNNADFILQKNDKNIIYFIQNSKIYSFVIKTTSNKEENYLTTYHIASKKQLEKDLKRYRQIKR